MCVGLVVSVALLAAATTAGSVSDVLSRKPLSGAISTSGIGPIRFGATPARLRAWAGPPEFTSPPGKSGSYPVPRHDAGVVAWGYHCQGQMSGGGRSSCHIVFGFRHGRLTAVISDSPLFALASGVHPGMTVPEARKREPAGVPPRAGCNGLLLPTPKGTVLKVYFAAWKSPRVFSLYASSGDPAFDVDGNYC